MALQSPYPIVQGSRFLLGPDLQGVTLLIVPGATDYTTGGYVVTAIECGFKAIQAVMGIAGNATAFPTSGGWYPEAVFPETQLGPSASPGAGFSGYSQFLFKVYVASTGVEIATSVNLAGAIWQVTILGY